MGELTSGSHPILAKDVKIGHNKNKVKCILHSSKTHSKGNYPQTVKVCSYKTQKGNTNKPSIASFCPYELLRKYAHLRGPIKRPQTEPFFVFLDGSPVRPFHMRNCLKLILKQLRYDEKLFSTHSFRIDRSGDLLKLGLSVETIKKLGRWKSNAVFRYLR